MAAPIKVTRFGRLVLAEFGENEGAVALEKDLADARLVQENPAEFRRLYAERHGIDETGVPTSPE